jgi:hypothetical protein
MKIRLSLWVALSLAGCFATVGRDERARRPVFTRVLPAQLPPLVVVQPGISVVGDLDDEVFYADGYYWSRQDGFARATTALAGTTSKPAMSRP